MASFKRFSKLVLGFSLLAASSFMGEACSVQLSGDFEPLTTRGKEGDDLANTAGGTSGGGGSVVLPPSNPEVGAPASFANVCGGGCMSEDKAFACPLPMDPNEPPSTSCQIVPDIIGAKAECLPPGTVEEGGLCEKVANCAASLGCVRSGSKLGVCRPYCCDDIEACAAGSYCALSAMADDVFHASPLEVPVCVPATPCTPLDDTTCPAGRTCTLVRADGTTSCVDPGAGKDGDGCPCSAGHVCVISTNTCRALCRVGGGDCLNGMFCQGGSEGFPDGFGVCVK